MPPEVLIVGDTRRRRELLDQVRSLRYGVSLCRPRDLRRHLDERGNPSAILVCSGDTDPELLLDNLRRERATRGVPVVLVGSYGQNDARAMGADAVLTEPAGRSRLRSVLAELAGPASGRTETLTRVADAESETARERTDWTSPGRRTRTSERGGPVLAQLHQTLDRLEARLADTPSLDDDIDDDLIDMSPNDVPEVEAEVPQRRSTRMPRPRRGPTPRPPEDIEDPQGDVTRYDGGERSARYRRRTAEESGQYERSGSVGRPRARREGSSTRHDRTDRLDDVPTTTRDHDRSSSAVLRARRPGREPRPRGRDPRGESSTRVRDTEAQARPAGSIGESPVYEQLWRLHRERFSGRLDVRRRRAVKSIWFADGEPVFAQSNVTGDRLVDRLLRRGVLTRAQYETARRLAAKAPRRAGQLLVEAGFLKPRELHAMLREQLARMIESTFSWTDGEYGIAPGDAVSESVLLDYPVELLVVQGLRDALEVPLLSAKLGPRTRCPRLLGGQRAQELGDRLRLSDELVDVLEELDGSRSIAECIAVPGRDEQEVLALMLGLSIVGAVELLEPGELDGGDDPVALDEQRLQARLALVRRADYFAVLGVPRDASKAEIRQAYRELEETFSDQSLETDVLRDRAVDVAELRFALQEAVHILLDDALRSAYLAHLGDPEPASAQES